MSHSRVLRVTCVESPIVFSSEQKWPLLDHSNIHHSPVQVLIDTSSFNNPIRTSWHQQRCSASTHRGTSSTGMTMYLSTRTKRYIIYLCVTLITVDS